MWLLAQEIGFSAPNSCSLPWLVIKGATQLCTSKKECNKLNLTAAQYFWLLDHNDWPRWFAISSPLVYAVPVTILLVGFPKKKKKKTAKLRQHTEHQWTEMLLVRTTWLVPQPKPLKVHSVLYACLTTCKYST